MSKPDEQEVQQNLTDEDYSQAMNVIGQNLYSSLAQSIDELPEYMRSKDLVMQALSGFVANIIHQQAPTDPDSCQETLKQVNEIIQMHLTSMNAE